MTALELIREGFGVWADGSSGNDVGATPIIFALLFLFGFLATAILKTFKIPQAIVADTSASLSTEGREVIDDANTARLFELESELASSKDALKRFTETLSTTFASMPGGLAIFDADKSLYLFNPALSSLLDLDPVWLARRPSISAFVSMLREKRNLPEKQNFLAWRRLLTGLQDTDPQNTYDDEWTLPDGRIFRVSGQPHPRGAVAFLFEDISASIASDRQRYSEANMNKSILDELPDAVAIIQSSGLASFTNTKFIELFGKEFCETLRERGMNDLSKDIVLGSDVAAFWSKLRTSVSMTENPARWKQRLTDQEGEDMLANVSALPDGSTLLILRKKASVAGDMSPSTEDISIPINPLNLDNLDQMLRQRSISLDKSGFDPACTELEDTAKLRRILWYLVISASDNCRSGGHITLSSEVEGQITRLSCYVGKEDRLDDVHGNLAANLLKQLVEGTDAKNIWTYESEVGSFTISFKLKLSLKLSAL